MSAYMCDDLHISVLAEYAVQNHVCNPDPDFKRDWSPAMVLGERLHAENQKSVVARYPGDSAMVGPAYEHVRHAGYLARQASAVQIIKAAQCLRYQSCEHEGWPISQAAEVLDGIISTAITKLPGYEQAMWGFPS